MKARTTAIVFGLLGVAACDDGGGLPAGDPPGAPPPVTTPLEEALPSETDGGSFAECISCGFLLEQVQNGGGPLGMSLPLCTDTNAGLTGVVHCGCARAACASVCAGYFCDAPLDLETMFDFGIFECIGCAAEAAPCAEAVLACRLGDPSTGPDGGLAGRRCGNVDGRGNPG